MEHGETFSHYRKRIDTALEDDFLRSAMDRFATAYRDGRKRAFEGMDADNLIKEVAAIKKEALQRKDELLSRFKRVAGEKGIHVHIASTADEANSIITGIAKSTGSEKIIKSKSMTAEEIHLNSELEKNGLEVTETDLGEWIVQLRHEGPSHMVMPAIHLSRFQVADLFSDVTGKLQDAEIERLVKVARNELRRKFIEADMGITGANFIIADTGTIGIVTNEGNARLTTTLPKVHVVIAGIDKLLPTLREALTVLKVLPRNATGQQITSYVTWITGPSESLAALSGKREMHVVLLDNGRNRIAEDPDFAQVLQCVRCGACANVCPVYRMVGGHRMGHIYIGAIGLITTYFFHGAENARNLVQNCTNCGACRAVCAAGIDLPRLIKEVHAKIQDEFGHPLKSLLLAKMMKDRELFHSLLKAASMVQRPVTGGTPYLRHLPMIFFKEHNFRVLPAISDSPFRKRWAAMRKSLSEKKKSGNSAGKLKVGIFSGCVQDFVYPEQLEAGIEFMSSRGVDISFEFPHAQSCCGLPALTMGEREAASDVALRNIEAFEGLNLDYIVTLCASCASHLTHSVPSLIKKFHESTPDHEKLQAESLAARADKFAAKVVPFSLFIKMVDKIVSENGSNEISSSEREKSIIRAGRKVTWHSPCHLCRGVGVRQEPKDLIIEAGNNFVQAREEETCCGFGGSFSASFPTISREILAKKLEDIENTGAEIVATECPGCVMQLRGGALQNKSNVKVIHLSELLADKM